MRRFCLIPLLLAGGCTDFADSVRTNVLDLPPVFREATPEERARICDTEVSEGTKEVAGGAAVGGAGVGTAAAGLTSAAGAAIGAITAAPVILMLGATSIQGEAERQAFCNGTMTPRVGGVPAAYSSPDPALCAKLGTEQAAQIGCPMM